MCIPRHHTLDTLRDPVPLRRLRPFTPMLRWRARPGILTGMSQELRLHLAEDDADDQRLAMLAAYLRTEVLRLDVEDVTALSAGQAPPGAKGSALADIGGLLVTLGQSADSLRSVIAAIQAWLPRGLGRARSVRIEIDGDELVLTDATRTDQAQLVALFINRHGRGGTL